MFMELFKKYLPYFYIKLNDIFDGKGDLNQILVNFSRSLEEAYRKIFSKKKKQIIH